MKRAKKEREKKKKEEPGIFELDRERKFGGILVWRLPAWTGSGEAGFKPITVRTKFSQVSAETSPAGVHRREHVGIPEKIRGKNELLVFAREFSPAGVCR